MAYYLGYKKDEEFYPINLDIDNADDILSLVYFTIDFETEENLIDYLYSEGLIHEESVELTYLIQKGKKDMKTYMPLPNINRIFYYGNSASFDLWKIKTYIEGTTINSTFIKYLLSSLLKKYGIDEHVRNFLMENIKKTNKRDYLISVLKTLLSNSNITLLNNKLQDLIEALKSDDRFLEIKINSFIELILNNNDALSYVYRLLKRHLNFPKVLEIDDLVKIELGIDWYHYSKTELKQLIDKFINHYVLSGQKINSRNLVDLGSMIQDYKDYTLALELENYKPLIKQEEDYDDVDEFLEEADFARYDTTSENAGIRLRPTDSSTWEMDN